MTMEIEDKILALIDELKIEASAFNRHVLQDFLYDEYERGYNHGFNQGYGKGLDCL